MEDNGGLTNFENPTERKYEPPIVRGQPSVLTEEQDNEYVKNETGFSDVEQKKNIKQERRIQALDVTRIIACILFILQQFVSYNSGRFKQLRKAKALSRWYWATFYNNLSQMFVPLYMMTSGAVLLSGKRLQYPLNNSLEYFFRRLLNYVVWGILYNLPNFMAWNWDDNPMDKLHSAIYDVERGVGVMWYPRIVLILHMITPISQSMMKGISREAYEMMLIGIFFVFEMESLVHMVLSDRTVYKDYCNVMFYFYLGPYLYEMGRKDIRDTDESEIEWIDQPSVVRWWGNVNWQQKKPRVVLCSVFIFTVLLAYNIQVRRTINYGKTCNWLGLDSPLGAIASASLFLLICSTVRNKPNNKTNRMKVKFTESVGSVCMAIFIMVNVLMYYVNKNFNKWFRVNYTDINPALFAPFATFVMLMMCWPLGVLMSRTPFLNIFVH